jgi:uncharacterized protein YqeY
VGTVHDELRRDLTAAMKRRDPVAVPALRSLLSALANAEAVEPDEASTGESAGPAPGSEHVAGTSLGVGSAEVERRRLGDEERDDIVRREVEERRQAAAQLRTSGHEERSSRLLAEAELLSTYCAAPPRRIVPPDTGA